MGKWMDRSLDGWVGGWIDGCLEYLKEKNGGKKTKPEYERKVVNTPLMMEVVGMKRTGL